MKMAATPRVWAVVKKHVPLIRFRKSAGESSHGHSHAVNTTAAATEVPAPAAAPTKPQMAVPRVTIEDWQLATRYKRRPMSQEEIDYINRGGPA